MSLPMSELLERLARRGVQPCGASILLYDGGSDCGFVALRRRGSHGEGCWSIPGGWVEKGEDPKAAAIREAWEEVGLHVASAGFLGYTADRHPEGFDAVTLWFESLGDEWSGRPRSTHPDKVEEVRVCRLEELPQPRFVPFQNGVAKGFVHRARLLP